VNGRGGEIFGTSGSENGGCRPRVDNQPTGGFVERIQIGRSDNSHKSDQVGGGGVGPRESEKSDTGLSRTRVGHERKLQKNGTWGYGRLGDGPGEKELMTTKNGKKKKKWAAKSLLKDCKKEFRHMSSKRNAEKGPGVRRV